MGQYVFKLPDVGEGTAEAEIVAWHVRVGDVVGEDAPLVDVMTDKATVEMTSPVAGKVIEINPSESELTPIADLWLSGAAGDILPRVLAALDAIRMTTEE